MWSEAQRGEGFTLLNVSETGAAVLAFPPLPGGAREKSSLPLRFLLENLQKSLLLPVAPQIARSWVINHWLFSSEQAMDVLLAQEQCRAEGSPTEATESPQHTLAHMCTHTCTCTLSVPILGFRKALEEAPAEHPAYLSLSS